MPHPTSVSGPITVSQLLELLQEAVEDGYGDVVVERWNEQAMRRDPLVELQTEGDGDGEDDLVTLWFGDDKLV